jgi:hypothetical protein
VNKVTNTDFEETQKIVESYVPGILGNIYDITMEVGSIAIEKHKDEFQNSNLIETIQRLKKNEYNTFSFQKEGGVKSEDTKKSFELVLKETNDLKIFETIWKEPVMEKVFENETLEKRFDGSE